MAKKNLWRFYPVRRHSPVSGVRQRGMTLVEWMVSITIGMVLLAGLTGLIVRQSSTQAELEKSSRQIENGRYAMQVLNDDIQLAGYYGEFSNVDGLTDPAALPDPCSLSIVDIEEAMKFSVQGYDALTTGLPSCINPANHLPGTDILVVRRVDPSVVEIASAASSPGQVFLQSGMTVSGQSLEKKMGLGADTSAFDLRKKDRTTLAPLRKFIVNIYFVSPCSVIGSGDTCNSASDDGNPIPTLKVIQLSVSLNTTSLTTTPLVEGIENLQIDYGIDTDGDGAPDGDFVTTIPDVPRNLQVKDWANVMALRIHLLARNNERSAGYTDTKNYNLGLAGSTTATNDGFKRRVFSQHTRLVNPSSRRDR